MVRAGAKPSEPEADCCKVEVMNGGRARRVTSFVMTSETFIPLCASSCWIASSWAWVFTAPGSSLRSLMPIGSLLIRASLTVNGSKGASCLRTWAPTVK